MKTFAKIFILVLLITVPACIRETYDFDKLSKMAHLSPTWVVPAVKGDVSLSDLVEANDTLIFEEDNFVRIIFRENSFIDLKIEDYYDLNDMVSFSETYQLGRMNVSSFSGNISYTLDRITRRLNPALRAQFVALNGTTSTFPSFPVTVLQEGTYSLFPNFEYALFDEGFIDVKVTNNLTAPLQNLSVTLFNTAGHIPVGDPAIIPFINPGETRIASIDLADRTVRNSLSAIVTVSSPGTTSPVYIDLAGSGIEIAVTARDLWVRSGRIVVPPQTISALGGDGVDTIGFDPGSGTQISYISMNRGDLSYTIRSGTELSSILSVTLPTTLKSGLPISNTVALDPNTTVSEKLPVDNSVFDLSTIQDHPYNMIPVKHEITVSSNGRIINFSSHDEVQIDIRFLDPDFDYVKGYFCQETESFGPETFDTEISDIINKISGGLYFSNPVLTFNYSNSFSIPVEVDLRASGYRSAERTDHQLGKISLKFPAGPAERDITGSFVINKTNSTLPDLISMPPDRVILYGTAQMNPVSSVNSPGNYIFGNSRLSASLEIDIPMELRMNNLQFTDTVGNFLRPDNEDDNQFDPADLDFMQINLYTGNGFPAGVSVSLVLYDSEEEINRATVETDEILKPAPVDSEGRVTLPAESTTKIRIGREFWDAVDQSDSIIFVFTMNTTDGGLKDVKIYSDYRIRFTAGLVVKPDLKFKAE